MALTFHSGFETGDLGEWDSSVGPPTVVEANGWGSPKTGTYCMQCDTTGGAATAYVSLSTASGADNQLSFCFYIATLPNSDCTIWRNGEGTDYYIQLTTDGYLKLYDEDDNLEDTSDTQLGTDTWYRIGICRHANDWITLYIGGSEEFDAADVGALPGDSFILGIGTSVTAALYFDDVVCGDSNLGDDLGDIRVAAASPNLAGTYAQYDTVSGYTNVDEIPASDVDFIHDKGGDAARESYNIPDLADLAGASSGDTVNAVSIWIRGDRNGGGGTDHKAMVRDNGSDYESDALAFDSIAWFNWYLAVMPDDNGAWLEARLNALEIGAYHNGGQDQRVHCLVAMVAYTPEEEPPPEGQPYTSRVQGVQGMRTWGGM